MNVIPQMKLFAESDFDYLGDLERLKTVLEVLDDGRLIRRLCKIRGKGRNDWPCEAMWNSFIASFLSGEETHQYRDTDLVYDYAGTMWHVGENGEKTEMQYKGYDKSTDSLRYGFEPLKQNGRNTSAGFMDKQSTPMSLRHSQTSSCKEPDRKCFHFYGQRSTNN